MASRTAFSQFFYAFPKNTAIGKLVFLSIDISCTIIAGADSELHIVVICLYAYGSFENCRS